METKRLHVEVKDADQGLVTARFATLGVKDLDGDIIEPGAFGKQRVKVSSFGHSSWMDSLPVGVGETREEGNQALADLEFFLNTSHGRDHFETIKGLGDLGEWSFGFDILEEAAPDEDQRQAGVNRILKKLNVFEVSPVLRGAGVDTATLSVKCEACAAKGNRIEEPDPEPIKESEPEPEPKAAAEPEPVDDLDAQVQQELARFELTQAKIGRP